MLFNIFIRDYEDGQWKLLDSGYPYEQALVRAEELVSDGFGVDISVNPEPPVMVEDPTDPDEVR